MEYAHKRMKYLKYMPDTTPIGLVEIDMKKLVDVDKLISKDVYNDNIKPIQQRKAIRQRKEKEENAYDQKMK